MCYTAFALNTAVVWCGCSRRITAENTPPSVPSKVFCVIKKRTGYAGCRDRSRTIECADHRIYQIRKHLEHAKFFRISNFRLHEGAALDSWFLDSDSCAGCCDSHSARRQG